MNNFFYKFARYFYDILPIFIRKLIWILLKKIIPKIIYPSYCLYNKISLAPKNLIIDVLDKEYLLNNDFPKYTCITPVLNEENTIIHVLQSIENLTLPPDQVIIVDGGSDDSTVDKIKSYKTNSNLDILLLHSPKKNIGLQRNIAVKKSRNNIIMNIDAGTYLDSKYAVNTLGFFADNPNVDLVCGVHYPKEEYPWSCRLSPKKHFEKKLTPYGACIVYKKDTALKIGLYPEYLTYAGEDTFFCYKYKKKSKYWVFNRKAILWWDHPSTELETEHKIQNYIKAKVDLN